MGEFDYNYRQDESQVWVDDLSSIMVKFSFNQEELMNDGLHIVGNKTAFTIKPMKGEDLPSLLALYRECEDFLALGPIAQASEVMVLADLELSHVNHGNFYGLMVDCDLAGVLDVVESGWEGESRSGYLELLMLAPRWRRHGIGEAATHWAEAQARLAGAEMMRLGVQVNNPGGWLFWERMGYHVVSEPTLFPDGTVAVEMVKPLTSDHPCQGVVSG
jgi:ribosomal protein S18 acetylase RimI-like enzyme